MRLSWLPLIILALLFIGVTDASATTMEFYTYNGFDAVTSAFQKVALIFSDDRYKGLFFTVTALGFFFAGFSSIVAALRGVGNGSLLGWLIPALLGVMLYFGLVVPKGTLNIYDPVKNRTQAVGDIPDGLVVIAGVMNLIERGIVDIVSTSSDPQSYQNQAGGVGFNTLLNLNSKGILLSDQYLHTSLYKYIDDCVLFEMTRTGTVLTLDRISSNTDFMTLFAEAKNPAIFTTFFAQTIPEGVTLACDAAYDTLKSYINDPVIYGSSLNTICANSGFDPTIPAELTQCKNTIENTTNWLGALGVDQNTILRQTLIAQTLNDVTMSNNTDLAIKINASRNTGTGMLSTGVVANEWIPVLKASLTAIAIGMVPFFALLIPTPFFKKAAVILVGFFVWLTLWGIIDAVVHSFATDYAYKTFQEVRDYQLGLTAIMNFGTASLKTLAAFAALRWSGLMLATVFTSAMGFFGGHALGMLAGQVTSPIQSASASAGKIATPEGQAHALQSFESAPAVLANANKFSFSQRSEVKTAEMTGGTQGGVDLIRNFGNAGAARMTADEGIGRKLHFGAQGAVAGEMGLPNAFGLNKAAAGFKYADTEATEKVFGSKNGYQAFQEWKKGKEKGEIDGQVRAYQDAVANGFKGDWQDYHSMQSEVSSMKSFADATVMKGIADKYYGGNTSGLFRSLSTYHNEQAAALLNKMGEHGYDPSTAAQYKGHIEALGQIGKARGSDVIGDRGMIQTSSGEVLNEGAKFELRSQMAQSLGHMKDDGDLKGFYDYLKQSHGTDSVVLDKGMADSLNLQMHAQELKHFNAQAGDKVDFGFDSSTGRIRVAHSVGGGRSSHDNIDTSEKGRTSGVYDLTTTRVGTDTQRLHINKGITDTRDQTTTGGEQASMLVRDDEGKMVLKDGVRYYDKDLKQAVFVAGSERYGMDKSGIRYQTAQYDDKGTMLRPGGLVYEDLKADPRTGQIIAGKNTSVLVSEGKITAGGKTFNAVITEDAKTGTRLAMDAKSGSFYMATRGSEAWTYQMDMDIRGKITASGFQKGLEKLGVSRETAQDIGYKIGIGIGGTSEVGGAINTIRGLAPNSGGGMNPTSPEGWTGSPYSQYPPMPVPPRMP